MVQPWPDQPSWLCDFCYWRWARKNFPHDLSSCSWYMFTPTSCMAAGSKSKMARLFVWFTHSKIFLPNFLQSGNAHVECQFQTGSYSVMYFQPESSCTRSVTTPYTDISVTSVTEGELIWTPRMSSVASILVHVHPPNFTLANKLGHIYTCTIGIWIMGLKDILLVQKKIYFQNKILER